MRIKDLADKLGISYSTLHLPLCRAEFSKYVTSSSTVELEPEFLRELYRFIQKRKRSTGQASYLRYEKAQKTIVDMLKDIEK